MGRLSEDQIQQLVGKYIKQSVERLDSVFEVGDDQHRPYDDPPSLHSYIEGLATVRQDLINSLNLGDFSMLENSIDVFLKANGIDEVDKASPEYRKLCVQIHKAETRLIPLQQRHMKGDFTYGDQLPKLFPEVFAAKDESPPERREGEPKKDERKKVELSQVFKEYWKEKEPTLKRTFKPEYEQGIISSSAIGHTGEPVRDCVEDFFW